MLEKVVLPKKPSPSPNFVNPSIWVRCVALAIVLGIASILYVTGRLTPSPTGYGTHRQLGYPPCLMPLLTGYPCPTCGMTTAFAYAARGQFLRAFHAQPAGLALFFALFFAGLISLYMVCSGNDKFVALRAHPVPIILLAAGILLSGWAYKIATFSA